MPIIENKNVPLDNKQLRIYDSTNKFIRVSIDETIARGYNSYKNWLCSAGIRGLYIDYDGNIWNANCASSYRNSKAHFNQIIESWRLHCLEVFGPMPHVDWINKNTKDGWPLPEIDTKNCDQLVQLRLSWKKEEKNFFSNLQNKMTHDNLDPNASPFQWISTSKDLGKYWGLKGNINWGMDITKKWTRCIFDNCGCGADICLSKAKNYKYQKKLDVTNNGETGTIRVDNYTETSIRNQVGVELNFPVDYQILWDLGRKCNYNCSYCWPSVHSNTEDFLSYKKIISAIDFFISEWSNGKVIRWNFGGGEPTIHEKFLDIIKFLKNKKQWVLVTTNGSRSTTFWKEAVKYINSINMSAHFASMDLYKNNEKRFIENCRVILQHHDIVDDDNWLEIKLMTPPKFLERAKTLKNKILDIKEWHTPGANGRPKGCISLVPIRSINDSFKIMTYNEQELEYFKNQ
jgi:organic radical activating enzyme